MLTRLETRIFIFCLTLLAGLLSRPAEGQFSMNVNSSDIPTSATVRVYEGDTGCGTSSVTGSLGNSSVDLDIDFMAIGKSAVDFLLNGEKPSISDIVTPVATCEEFIASIKGAINAYLTSTNPNIALVRKVSGNVAIQDMLRITVTEPQTIELRITASAALSAIQTFTDPSDSHAKASASITAQLGANSVTAGGEVEVNGGFTSASPSESTTTTITVGPGTTNIPLNITGSLEVESRVKGIGAFMVSASNAVAVAGNSVNIHRFTGPDGEPLPEGVIIEGLTTGMTYHGDPEPLPVELSSFDALAESESVILRWQTQAESNNAGFEVHRMGPGTDQWEVEGFIQGRGTTAEPVEYVHRIANLEPGQHRFRLRQIDFDGTGRFGPTISAEVEVAGTHFLSPAYPNPFNPQTTFNVAVPREQHVTIALHDALGRMVLAVHDGALTANQQHRFEVNGESLPSGIYLLRVAGDHFSAVRKVTLVK